MFGPAYDSVPDMDHAATLAMLLQTMLLYKRGKSVTLFGAFPKNWNVKFRLWLDAETFVEGEQKNGKQKIKCNHPERYDFQGGHDFG